MTTATETGYSNARLLAEALAELQETYELVYVAYDDMLTDDQVNNLMTGDTDSLFESTWEWEADQRDGSTAEYVKELVDDILARWEREDDLFDADVLRDVWNGSEQAEELRQAIQERDGSDWLTQLARHTPDVLCRIRLAEEDFNAEWGSEPTAAEFIKALGQPGIEATPENMVAAREIIDNAQTYGVIYALVAVSVADFVPLDGNAVFRFTDPHILLSNPYAGNGHEAQLHGVIEVPQADVQTDAGQFGYSWNTIAGVYTGGYREEYTVTSG